MESRLELGAGERALLTAWARAAAPREACGLLLGRNAPEGARVVEVVRARNRRAAPGRFEIDPGDVVAADRRARSLGLELLGAWHSHAQGCARPSAADRAGAWAGVVSLIVAPAARDGATLRAWICRAGTWRELRLARRGPSEDAADPTPAHSGA